MYFGSFKKASVGGGYSSELATDLLRGVKLVLVSELIPRYAWSDDTRSYTDEVVAQSIFVASSDLSAPLEVKLPKGFSLPSEAKFLSQVYLEEAEACQVRSQIYFRAKGVKEAK